MFPFSLLDEATVEFRIFAQARKEEALSDAKFLRPITDVIMQSCKSLVGGDTASERRVGSDH